MENIVLRAFALVLMIAAGILMRAFGIADEGAAVFAKKLLMYVTLPAAIITNFSGIGEMNGETAVLIFMGIAANLIMIGAGALLTKTRSREEKAIYMNCLPAYNIGAFCLPFVQTFLPASGSIAACLFDVGNSLMCTGGTYAINMQYLSGGGFGLRMFAGRLLGSPPLLVYMVMIALSLLHIRLGDPILVLIAPAAAANTFVAMLVIGLLFRIKFEKAYLSPVLKMLFIRQAFAVVMSLFCYFALPFPLEVRRALVLVSFGPMSVVSPVFTGLCGGDEGKAGAANSVTILVSIVEIMILLAVI